MSRVRAPFGNLLFSARVPPLVVAHSELVFRAQARFLRSKRTTAMHSLQIIVQLLRKETLFRESATVMRT